MTVDGRTPVGPERLQRWAAAHLGDGARVERVERMPGNAGISFGFDVVAGSLTERLVIRVPPPGVRRQGSTDILRQAPLLRAAADAGVPVPPVRWCDADEQWFGVPYLIVDRMPGRSPDRWGTGGQAPAVSEAMFEQAIEALVVTHRIPWEAHLPGWAEPRTLRTEVAAWERALGKADDPEWISQGLELRDRLLAALPLEPAPGVVHGDFYPTNWLFDDGRLTAVVDWEIAAVGPTLLDLGWLCMMQDPASWAPSLAPPTAWHGDPEDLITLYEKLSGSAVPDLAWYRALAAWRFGAIIALNVHLHRSGRRHDPVWELMAESFPALIDRGLQLLRP